MVTTSQILHVYSSNLAQWMIDIFQIQNLWKYEKYRDPIYNVTHYVMWTFWSKIAFGLQIIHQNRFETHLEPQLLIFECLYQSTSISRSGRLHLCPHIYNPWRVKKSYWCHLLTQQLVRNMDTKKIRNNPSKYKYTLRICNIGKQSGCLHVVKVQPETRP